ncbi:MAG: hypothetical protein EBY16_08100 [Gammaproteobacteria bacterium]|nr:hypothetical protein [Gammaproteobacteria bacterium]
MLGLLVFIRNWSPRIISLSINPDTGLRVNQHTPGSIEEYFIDTNIPADDSNEDKLPQNNSDSTEDLF